MDDIEARGTSEARLNAIVQAAAEQLQQLVEEYERRPDATVAGLGFIREEAAQILKTLGDIKKRLMF